MRIDNDTLSYAESGTAFSAGDSAVRQIRLFFGSICSRLLTATGAVLAKQWLASYEMTGQTGSAEIHGLRITEKSLAAEASGVSPIVESLPTSPYVAPPLLHRTCGLPLVSQFIRRSRRHRLLCRWNRWIRAHCCRCRHRSQMPVPDIHFKTPAKHICTGGGIGATGWATDNGRYFELRAPPNRTTTHIESLTLEDCLKAPVAMDVSESNRAGRHPRSGWRDMQHTPFRLGPSYLLQPFNSYSVPRSHSGRTVLGHNHSSCCHSRPWESQGLIDSR